MTEQVRCLDCKHRKVTIADWFAPTRYRGVCLKSWVPEERKFDPVVGEEITKGHYESPGITRLGGAKCGKDGKLWEPKNRKDLFKFIKHVSA